MFIIRIQHLSIQRTVLMFLYYNTYKMFTLLQLRPTCFDRDCYNVKTLKQCIGWTSVVFHHLKCRNARKMCHHDIISLLQSITNARALCLEDREIQYFLVFSHYFFLPDSILQCVVRVQIFVSLKLTFNRMVQNDENFRFHI
jgi:hypothetical protein